MTSSEIEQTEDKLVHPVTAQLNEMAKKHDPLILSVQDPKQQLVSAEQRIATNEITIKCMSTKLQQLQDGLDVTQLDLNNTTIKGNKIKEELTKQCEKVAKRCEELLEAFAQLSSSNQELSKAFTSTQRNILTASGENVEKMKIVIEEATMLKEKLEKDVVATSEIFEKGLSVVKEEIQSFSNETRKAEDNLSQLLISTEAKVTASIERLSNSHCERVVTSEQIENIKQDLINTKESLKQELEALQVKVMATKDELLATPGELAKQIFSIKQGLLETKESLRQELQALQKKVTATKEELLANQNKPKIDANFWITVAFTVAFIGVILALMASQYVPDRIAHGGLDTKFKAKISNIETTLLKFHHESTEMRSLLTTLLSKTELKTEISNVETTLQKCHHNISETKSLVTNLLSKTEFKTKISNIESTLQKHYDEITKTNLATFLEVTDLQAKISEAKTSEAKISEAKISEAKILELQAKYSEENEPTFLYRFLCTLGFLLFVCVLCSYCSYEG